MSKKTFYLLQRRRIYEKKYQHVAFGDNVQDLINNYIKKDDISVESYIITEFETGKLVYRCFQKNVLVHE